MTLPRPVVMLLLAAHTSLAWGPAETAAALKPALRARVREELAKPLSNLTGGIAWGTSYSLDALLDAYLASADAEFLDLYVPLADAVIGARADKTGERDWKGELRKGWPTAGHYTLGVPFTLLDASGKPSFELQAIENAGNDSTWFEVTAGAGGAFTLTVEYGFRRATPLREVFDDLTVANAETRVNPKPGQRARVRIRRLGDAPPRPYARFQTPTEKVVLHGHHTGRVVAPLARFAAIVAKRPELARFRTAAAAHLRAAQESMADAASAWREQDGYGYMVFEKGIPFWCDGFPEPYNVLASTGSAYLALYDADGNAGHLRRARLLARRIQMGLEPAPDGTVLHHYWWGVVHTGWKPADGVSVHTPLYKGVKTIEDNSHFQLTARFLAECLEHGLVFTREDAERVARTFHRKVFKADQLILADRLDGAVLQAESPATAGRFNRNFAGWAALGKFDCTIAEALHRWAAKRSPAALAGDALSLYGWAVLATVEATCR